MSILSQPRPDGSPAELETLKKLCSWLEARSIHYRIQNFKRYPYFFESLGVWLILSRLALAIVLWLNLGWIALVIASTGLAVELGEMMLGVPLVTRLGADTGKNLLVEFQPASTLRQIILCAHYDSKTEPLDHRQRMILLRLIPFGLLLTLLLGISAVAAQILAARGLRLGIALYWTNALLVLPLLLLAFSLGLNLSIGRFLPSSRGAVDNGAACAILLSLAEHLHKREDLPQAIQNLLESTRLTIALFTGEETNMQGSRAFVRARKSSLPAFAVNLEIMAQDGDYVVWLKDGTVFRQLPASEFLNNLLAESVTSVTGKSPVLSGPLTSDGGSFLSANLPATTLGTTDRALGFGGFHSPQDNLERVIPERLNDGVEILLKLLTGFENTG